MPLYILKTNTHKDLDVWKLGIELVELIYTNSKAFPKEEIYGLTSQLRRSAVSVPSNIAEGYARAGNKELVHFLYIALGSLSELETQVIISINFEYIQDDSVLECIEIVRRKLLNLIKYQKSKM